LLVILPSTNGGSIPPAPEMKSDVPDYMRSYFDSFGDNARKLWFFRILRKMNPDENHTILFNPKKLIEHCKSRDDMTRKTMVEIFTSQLKLHNFKYETENGEIKRIYMKTKDFDF
jgi:hypothetical protein